MRKNVLVFPCGSEIGLEIYRSLNLSIHFNLYGGSSVDDHGKFVYQNYIPGLPNIDDEDFTEKLNDVIDEYSIDYIYPAHDSVVLKLSMESERQNLHCEAVVSPIETCQVARSKRRTYETLEDVIPTPHVFKGVSDLQDSDFPIFLKPDVGQGSKGVYKANTTEEVNFYRKKDATLLLLEYIPGKEYTVDCFTNQDGDLLFCRGRERRRVSNGISVNSTWSDNNQFRDYAERINKKLSFNGAWFFQLKERTDGELALLEIAPRIAGTMGLTRGQGVNLPLLSLFNASGIKVTVFDNDYTLEIDRALENKFKHNIVYSHVYMDFDDLVIIDGQVNSQVIAFIFQSINKGVKIHLLTRHIDDIKNSLKKYRLSELFDEVVWLKDGEDKSTYINEDDAIFIDDSFSERIEVKSNKNIPVFDGHMIESLMD